MSRADASAYPPNPSDRDVHDISGHFHWECDEFPTNDDSALEDAMWPLLAGDVIQPHHLCGKWGVDPDCADCKRALEQLERDALADERASRSWHSETRPTRRRTT